MFEVRTYQSKVYFPQKVSYAEYDKFFRTEFEIPVRIESAGERNLTEETARREEEEEEGLGELENGNEGGTDNSGEEEKEEPPKQQDPSTITVSKSKGTLLRSDWQTVLRKRPDATKEDKTQTKKKIKRGLESPELKKQKKQRK
ncbi:Hypothetical protein FKW44_017163 [Caligus rogercresseyi]|uniref:Uncharacterized protein n=1 Tax=Caligus rogercresseyi TaxID=217165 RepID=A0A7T8H2T4_CALRO|nr:Hypothetical protein FKW44_017163 [Caligus rogercresseyi]